MKRRFPLEKVAVKRRLRFRPHLARGYTMIEVMMGMAILAVGASGVIALQKITVAGVTNGRNINLATSIAQAHVEAVRADATQWQGIDATTLADDYLDAVLLNTLLPRTQTTPGAWMMPTAAYAGGPGFGISDVNGETAGAVGTSPVGFCTHMRLVPIMFDPNSPRFDPAIAGGGPNTQARDALLIRVEVRTFWAKSGRDVLDECTAANVAAMTGVLAGTPITIAGVSYRADDYGWVFLASAVRPNEFVVVN